MGPANRPTHASGQSAPSGTDPEVSSRPEKALALRSKSDTSGTSVQDQNLTQNDHAKGIELSVASSIDADTIPELEMNVNAETPHDNKSVLPNLEPDEAVRKITEEEFLQIKKVYCHALFVNGIVKLPSCGICGVNAPNDIPSTATGHFYKKLIHLIKHIEVSHPERCPGEPEKYVFYYEVPYDDAKSMSEGRLPNEPVVITSKELDAYGGSRPCHLFLKEGKSCCISETMSTMD